MTATSLPGESAVLSTYVRYPVTLVRGDGSTVWDEGGRAYVDLTGFRCGDWLAISHAGVVPDGACLAKALGGGLPIERDGLLARSLEIGARLTAAVAAAAPAGSVAEIRGHGCLWGFELAAAADGTPADANAVVLRLLEEGVLASIAGPNVVRMSPPLTASDADVDRAAVALGDALATVEVLA